ncbi:uncharacterized protein MONOS_16894 [Monocercomonoides exilis]|uniref:uncharacterized protein n=1 Tax=Monocercomonoides exilis TaxID=2049356 RepID=UPI00355A8355|nr:hypothetical protein MONOS_16894 [Monocercomonoides exilis]
MFLEKLSQMEQCTDAEQKQKIEEMNTFMDEMEEEEFESVFKRELFNEIDQMIEEKKMSMENAIMLLKNAGFCKELKCFLFFSFDTSLLSKRLEKIINDENEKKEEKNERLLTDLCECYLLLHEEFKYPPKTMTKICVPCLLKVASNKDESEKKQKEVEMALFALSTVIYRGKGKIVYLNEIKEIIKFNQKHSNLTRLAYWSVWKLLFRMFSLGINMEGMIAKELHFAREAKRELEELTKCVKWTRKEEEEKGKEVKEVLIIRRWIRSINDWLFRSKLWNEESVLLVEGIALLFYAAKNNCRDFCDHCIFSLRDAVHRRAMMIEDLLKGGSIDVFLAEIQQQTLKDDLTRCYLDFFLEISEKLERMRGKDREEMKRKIFEKMEEEGYEDAITSFNVIIPFLKTNSYYFLPKYYGDYLINI